MATIVNTETFGQRLKRLRVERDLSQRQIETEHTSYAYISRLERDERNPGLRTVLELAELLEVTPLFLLTGQETDCIFCGANHG